MSTSIVGWTAPIAKAKVHVDPSGVQQASTNFQALLLPGMSTVTPRLRYISLFAAARYYRMEAARTEEEQVMLEQQLPLDDYFRRFEALVAACTIHHHLQDITPPNGIVGLRTMRSQLQYQDREIELKSGVQNPPYYIYRGTLSNLRIFDTAKVTDPLFERAIALGKAWDIEQAGRLGLMLKAGVLPPSLALEEIAKIDRAFCLCSIPAASQEQNELTSILFAKGLPFPSSSHFVSDYEMIEHTSFYRSLAWCFVLKLIHQHQGQPLGSHLTLINLLDSNKLTLDRHPAFKEEMMAWRWVAARTFFERGWIGVFQNAIETVKKKNAGLSTNELIDLMRKRYTDQHQDEKVGTLYQELEKNLSNRYWLKDLFTRKQPRDFLVSILLGLYVTKLDKEEYHGSLLKQLWSAGPIPFSNEDLQAGRELKASEWWSGIAEESLLQHFSISLRKMSDGNPDSLLVDFDAGKWRVRDVAVDVQVNQADGSTRLDIALSWALQLGLIKRLHTSAYELTLAGHQCCEDWDRYHE